MAALHSSLETKSGAEFGLTRLNKASLEPLQTLVAADLASVNQLIVERMHSEVGLIPELAGHIVAGGGKRLRPMITLAAARLAGYHGERHLKLAASVEFIHTATLLHDDVVDDSRLRRGQTSANAMFGNKASVLVGDFLFSRAFTLMVEDGSLTVLDILSKASAVIAEGEVQQLLTMNDLGTDEAAHLSVIRAKTAALFAAAAEIGAIVAEASAEARQALHDFGHNLGMAYQLVDDALDYGITTLRLGKTIGDDFRDGKITLPVIFAHSRANSDQREFWQRTLERLEQTDADLAVAQTLLIESGALNASLARAEDYAAKAKSALAYFPDSPLRRALCEAVVFGLERGG